MNPNKGNVEYFKTIDTNLKAYFLGFIAADGCITNGNRLVINVVKDDRVILDKFVEELGCESHLYNTPKKIGRCQITFSMSDNTLVNNIRKYGIQERKSLTIENIITNIPEKFRSSFILGYFDGDGYASISYSEYTSKKTLQKLKYPILHVGFCGTEKFLNGIISEIKLSHSSIKFKSGIYNLYCGSSKEDNIKIFDYLYSKNDFFLKRKYIKFMEYFSLAHIEINQEGTISSPT